ncbi:MAG TPA: hypothetical protein VL523_18415 [Terriglobia bacterium]|nr:hypothetical protein [Terriglobia bacterium]
MTKKLVMLLAAMLVFGSMAWAETITGVVSDGMCGLKHSKASAEAAACVKRCTATGDEELLLVSEGKIYRTLDQAKLKGFEGQEVKVTGRLEKMGDDQTITIESVVAAGSSKESSP